MSLTGQHTHRVNRVLCKGHSLAGMGICQMAKFIVGPALSGGRLVSLFPDYHLPLHNIDAVYPQSRFMLEKLLLLEFFLLHFNQSSRCRMRD